MKKRILIVSDSIKRKTGYATVAKNLIKNLLTTNKYEIAQLGLADFNEPTPLPIKYYSGIKIHQGCCPKGAAMEYSEPGKPTIYIDMDPFVQPCIDQKPCIKGMPSPKDAYAYQSVFFVINHYKPDIVISINDIWGLYNIVHLQTRKNFKFIPYLAIDSECMFPQISPVDASLGLPPIDPIHTLANSDEVIVFTDWAQEVINKVPKILKRELKEPLKLRTIPHGVDTSIWSSLPNKKELREKYFNIKDDVFLIGSVARNQPRKRLDAILQTMRYFIDNFENKAGKKIMCYFHCALEDKMGWNLEWLAQYYDVHDRCIFNDKLQPGQGPNDYTLNEMVNCFDVHLSLTNSEGWHLPALETCAAGIPNILTDYSAHKDWGKGVIIPVKVAVFRHEEKTGFVKADADIKHAAHQLKLLYNSPKLVELYKAKGIELGKKLDWKNVCKQWEELLDSIDISDLDVNRYNILKLDHNNLVIPVFPEDPTTEEFELMEL